MTEDEKLMHSDLEAAYLDVQALKMSVANHKAHAESWKREARQANATIAKLQAYMNNCGVSQLPVHVFHDINAIITGVK